MLGHKRLVMQAWQGKLGKRRLVKRRLVKRRLVKRRPVVG